MTALLNWLDDRTGYKGFVQAALYEHIPGGARWRYVWGSTLMFGLMVQMVTGLLLWMHYSPSAQTAWESVYYIQHEMTGGWLLRGIHHYTAQVMIILLALHMLQVIVDGAYRAPREINFWIGLVLLNLVLAISLTGYLLPWDQRGFWSTRVATSIMNVVPVVGPYLKRLVVGGSEYGHHTLTRFFAVHAGLLPFLMMAFVAVHVYLFRKHGLRYKEPKRGPDAYFWADQVLKDAVACLGVLLVVLLLCVKHGITGAGFDDPGKLGAPLSAPADPSEPFGAARPEWYFLFLFQFLKLPWFAGHGEVYGAIVIPGVIMFLLFLMPLVGRWKVGHWFNVLLVTFLATGMVLLTTMAVVEDVGRPHASIPLLNRLGLRFSVGWIGLLMLLVLSLIPMIGRERSFRTNLYVLAGLVFGVIVAVAVVVAGGGGADVAQEAAATTAPVAAAVADVGAAGFLKSTEQVHLYLLLAMLGGLVLLITMVLLKSPARVSGRIAADTEVTAAADAEAAGAAAANTSGPDDVAPPAEVSEGSWIRRWERHHRFRLALLFVVLGGTVLLTAISLVGGASTESKRLDYIASVKTAERDAARAFALAGGPDGIPPQGAVWLLRNDPMTQGPRLFARHCASCHRYDGHNGLGAPEGDPQSAMDLKGFASRGWIAGLLDPAQVDGVRYFGPNMKAHAGKMVEFVKDTVADAIKDEQDKADLHKIVVALAAEANLPAERDANASDMVVIAGGRVAISGDAFECTDCHNFHDKKANLGGANRGPDLTGYGSRQWLVDFIRNPAHPRFYGSRNDRMPPFGEQKVLDDHQIGLIVDWVRGDESGSASSTLDTARAVSPEPVAAPSTPAPEGTPSTVPVTAATAPATAPAATRPAETRPVETKPTEPAPAATKPSEPFPKPEPPPLESEFELPPKAN
jgi:quinol-cytochrome oxidoreductase complex cytochrome b subunit/mono/diheme cytochrome c family protein